MHKTGFYLKVM